jgi:hypothetical protein
MIRYGSALARATERVRGPGSGRRPIVIALGLTSLAHAAGLVLVQAGPAQAGGRAAGAAAVLQVRTLVPAVPDPVAPVATSERAPSKARDALVPDRSVSLAAASPAPAPAPAPAPISPLPAPAPTLVSPALSAPRDGLLLDYIPRSLLTTPPVATSAIEIVFPAGVDNDVHLTAELSLFIDETGVVQYVRVDSEALPPVMEAAARTAFLRGRFSPGEVQGRPVRSVIRVEVSFEAQTQSGPGP